MIFLYSFNISEEPRFFDVATSAAFFFFVCRGRGAGVFFGAADILEGPLVGVALPGGGRRKRRSGGRDNQGRRGINRPVPTHNWRNKCQNFRTC